MRRKKPPANQDSTGVPEDFMKLIDASYSADTISMKDSKVRVPFKWEGKLRVSTGGVYHKAKSIHRAHTYAIMPKAKYKGKTHRYEDRRDGQWMGYEGMVVSFRNQPYVLTDQKEFHLDKTASKPAPPPIRQRDSELGTLANAFA